MYIVHCTLYNVHVYILYILYVTYYKLFDFVQKDTNLRVEVFALL